MTGVESVQESGDRADRLVRMYVIDQCYRGSDRKGKNKHLLACKDATADVSVDHVLCYDTGVDGMEFNATITCPHGEREEYEYCELGDLPWLLEELARDYPDLT